MKKFKEVMWDAEIVEGIAHRRGKKHPNICLQKVYQTREATLFIRFHCPTSDRQWLKAPSHLNQMTARISQSGTLFKLGKLKDGFLIQIFLKKESCPWIFIPVRKGHQTYPKMQFRRKVITKSAEWILQKKKGMQEGCELQLEQASFSLVSIPNSLACGSPWSAFQWTI